MPVTYTNRKNFVYTLYRGTTKTGKSRYYFAKESAKGTPCETIPHGYEISESPNGVVSLVKSRPKLIRKNEADMVQKLIDEHRLSNKYRIFVKHNRIDIYERLDPSADELIDMFKEKGLGSTVAHRQFGEWWDSRGQFAPVLRFFLHDERTRMYRAERMCYLGSIEDWIDVGPIDRLEVLAKDMIGRLGTDSFFEVY
ncbi:MAG: hypothetical protein JRK26_26645 [Deltaproteobacteria bacterium]|nr:hypothetical protein [Deltaproteobacteria bacterium]